MKNVILTSFFTLVILATASGQSVIISEVSLCTNQVELQNTGTTSIDIGTWQLCNRNASSGGPFYSQISSLVGGASTLLASGDFITISWSKIEGPTGELGLYINNSFSNPNSMVDYMQFNAGNNIRASVAVTAQVWDDINNFVVVDDMPGCATVIANGTDPMSTNSTTWCTALSSTLGLANSACATLSPSVIISEVSLCTNQVELQNTGTMSIDIGTWQLCNRNAASGGPFYSCLLYTSPSPRDRTRSRMPSSA